MPESQITEYAHRLNRTFLMCLNVPKIIRILRGERVAVEIDVYTAIERANELIQAENIPDIELPRIWRRCLELIVQIY
jgi:hypothetical protein